MQRHDRYGQDGRFGICRRRRRQQQSRPGSQMDDRRHCHVVLGILNIARHFGRLGRSLGPVSRLALVATRGTALTAHRRRYPFLLPNVLGALLCLVNMAAVAGHVPETLPASQRRSIVHLPRDVGTWLQAKLATTIPSGINCLRRRRQSPSLEPRYRKAHTFDVEFIASQQQGDERDAASGKV